jgi:hypothetical protein
MFPTPHYSIKKDNHNKISPYERVQPVTGSNKKDKIEKKEQGKG